MTSIVEGYETANIIYEDGDYDYDATVACLHAVLHTDFRKAYSVAYCAEEERWRTFEEVTGILACHASFVDQLLNDGIEFANVANYLYLRLVMLEVRLVRKNYESNFKGDIPSTDMPYTILNENRKHAMKKEYKDLVCYDSILPFAFCFRVVGSVVFDRPVVKRRKIVQDFVCDRKDYDLPLTKMLIDQVDETKSYKGFKYSADNGGYRGNGQMKLAIDMIRFIRKNPTDAVLVIGASPFSATSYVAASFPMIDFYVYDLNPVVLMKDFKNIIGVPFLTKEFWDSLEYARKSIYFDVHDGTDCLLGFQYSVFLEFKATIVRFKRIVDFQSLYTKRIKGSTFWVLHCSVGNSGEYSEYFNSVKPPDIIEYDESFMEEFMSYYNQFVRCTKTHYSSKLTGCSCYDCSFVDCYYYHAMPDWYTVKFKNNDDYETLSDLGSALSVVHRFKMTREQRRVMKCKHLDADEVVMGSDINGVRSYFSCCGYASDIKQYHGLKQMRFERIRDYGFLFLLPSGEMVNFASPSLFLTIDEVHNKIFIRFNRTFETAVFIFSLTEFCDYTFDCFYCTGGSYFDDKVTMGNGLFTGLEFSILISVFSNSELFAPLRSKHPGGCFYYGCSCGVFLLEQKHLS